MSFTILLVIDTVYQSVRLGLGLLLKNAAFATSANPASRIHDSTQDGRQNYLPEITIRLKLSLSAIDFKIDWHRFVRLSYAAMIDPVHWMWRPRCRQSAQINPKVNYLYDLLYVKMAQKEYRG